MPDETKHTPASPVGAVTPTGNGATPTAGGAAANGGGGTLRVATSAEAPPAKRKISFFSTFEALGYPNFRSLWIGNFFGGGALWIQQITVPWLVYDLTGSGKLLGLVQGAFVIPIALVAPISGVLADRMDRAKILMAAQLYLGIVAALFAVNVQLGHVQAWHVFVFVLLIGGGFGFMMTTGQTLIPTMVPRHAIVNAAALGSTSQNATRAIGPAIGGQLIVAFGVAGNFFIQAVFYVLAFVFVSRIKLSEEARQQQLATKRMPFFKTMGEGFSYLKSDRPVLALVIMGVIPMVFLFPTNALMPIFAEEVFHRGAKGFGILLTAIGVGALIGTLGVAAIGDMKRKALVLLSLLMGAFAMVILFAWTTSLPLALLMLGVQGACQTAYFSLQGATLQLKVPNHMLGRVMSVSALNIAMIPLGGLVGGVLADGLSAPWAVTILGVGGVSFMVVAAFALPALRKL
ncbi:MAG: MFS transporter [Dehalococcoidia bacterium]|nr:MFS transporter [Dehalococcoidia bacterium]